MTPRSPVLVRSRDDATQDSYVLALRHRRRAAIGVATYQAALELDRIADGERWVEWVGADC